VTFYVCPFRLLKASFFEGLDRFLDRAPGSGKHLDASGTQGPESFRAAVAGNHGLRPLAAGRLGGLDARALSGIQVLNIAQRPVFACFRIGDNKPAAPAKPLVNLTFKVFSMGCNSYLQYSHHLFSL
jgi:hypothetical protein